MTDRVVEFELIDSAGPIEKTAHNLKIMSDGGLATVSGDEVSELHKTIHEPYSHNANGQVLANFYLKNLTGPSMPSTAGFVLEALQLIADQNWVDYVDYLDNGHMVRYFFFYMEGRDGQTTIS